MKIQKQKGILALVLALLGVPIVSASVTQTGISALNKALELISGLMTLPVLKNQVVQLGLIRFGLFLMVFSVAFYGLRVKKTLDQKPAAIVSFIVGFVGAALMPEKWVYLNGSIFVVLVAGIVPIGLLGFGIYFAMKKLKAGKDGEDWWKELAGLLLLLFLLQVITIYASGISGGAFTYNNYPSTIGGQVGSQIDQKLSTGDFNGDVNVNIAGDVNNNKNSLFGDDNSVDTSVEGDTNLNIGSGNTKASSTTNTNSESTSVSSTTDNSINN